MDDDEIKVTWNSSPTAGVTYNVYRSTASGGPYSAIATGVTSAKYTDEGVDEDDAYYYVVKTQKNGVKSVASNEASSGDDEDD